MERRLTAAMPSSRSEDWQPLMTYKNSLLHGETDQMPVTSKRAYSRKKKDYDHDDDEEHDDEDDQDYVA